MTATPNADKGTPVTSATILMLRDGTDGLEVFLLERHGLSDVLGGAFVFPGGKMDRGDADLVHLFDRPLDALHEALAEPDMSPLQAGAMYVTAIREAFEEAGVLFGNLDHESVQRCRKLLSEGLSFEMALARYGARLDPTGLIPWARWITPVNSVLSHKRFDSRFFVATVPAAQEPSHDNHEATRSLWLRPREALRRYWEGEIQFPPPQIMTLAEMSRYADTSSVLSAAGKRKPPRVQPELVDEDGLRVLCFPGDPRHSLASRAVAGPTRLCWRNDRYEPVEGYEVLFS